MKTLRCIDILAVVILCVVVSAPTTGTFGFAGGGGNCTFDDDSKKCATGGAPGSNCQQDRSTCKAGTTWETCSESEGNVSEACKNDNACSAGKNAVRTNSCS